MKKITKNQMTLLEGCRTLEQYIRTRIMYERGECNFCDVEANWDPDDIVFAGMFIWGVRSQYPVDHSAAHGLIIPRRHILRVEDMNDGEWTELREAREMICEEFDIDGGGFFERFGEAVYHRGSVEHWHGNIVQPDLSGEVRLPLAKSSQELVLDVARAEAFHVAYFRMSEEGKVEDFLAGTYNPPEGRHWDARSAFSEAPEDQGTSWHPC